MAVMRDFIVPGHPVGDIIPDIGEVIGSRCLIVAADYSDLGKKWFDQRCKHFMLECEHAGVCLSPLTATIRIGRFLSATRKFRVEAVDSSKFQNRYHDDVLERGCAELRAGKEGRQ